MSDGIRHFGGNAGVKAEKLLTAEEAAEIKNEIAALPPIGWLTDTDDAEASAAFASLFSPAPSFWRVGAAEAFSERRAIMSARH